MGQPKPSAFHGDILVSRRIARNSKMNSKWTKRLATARIWLLAIGVAIAGAASLILHPARH
jgi:hypothetical protein